MRTVTGVFESGEVGRQAVGRLREAGFPARDISFVLTPAEEEHPPAAIEQAGDAGRRLGGMAADVGETAVSFLPFLGRTLPRSPMAHALRDVAESAGESTGRIIGAAVEGDLIAPTESSAPRPRRASVVLLTAPSREAEAAALLAMTGAGA